VDYLLLATRLLKRKSYVYKTILLFLRLFFFIKKLIGTKGCSTPMGLAGRLKTPQACRGGSRISPPHGKRAHCSGNHTTKLIYQW